MRTRSNDQLDPFNEQDLAVEDKLDEEDAKAAEHIATAMSALREKSGIERTEWAEALGIELHELRLIENAQLADGPSASLLLRAAWLCGGKLKISFGKNEKAVEI